MGERMLLVEDDARLAEMLSDYLGQAGFRVTIARAAATASRNSPPTITTRRARPDAARHRRPRSLPPRCARTRRHADPDADRQGRRRSTASSGWRSAPTTTCPSRSSRASCWRACAPSCAARAAAAADAARCASAALEIDRDARTCPLDGKPRELTSYQFDLLRGAGRAGRPGADARPDHGPRQGRELEAFDRSIDVHMCRIRAAIEDDPEGPGASSPCAARATCSPRRRTERMSRLYLRIHFALLGSLIVFAGIAAVLWHVRGGPAKARTFARRDARDAADVRRRRRPRGVSHRPLSRATARTPAAGRRGARGRRPLGPRRGRGTRRGRATRDELQQCRRAHRTARWRAQDAAGAGLARAPHAADADPARARSFEGHRSSNAGEASRPISPTRPPHRRDPAREPPRTR